MQEIVIKFAIFVTLMNVQSRRDADPAVPPVKFSLVINIEPRRLAINVVIGSKGTEALGVRLCTPCAQFIADTTQVYLQELPLIPLHLTSALQAAVSAAPVETPLFLERALKRAKLIAAGAACATGLVNDLGYAVESAVSTRTNKLLRVSIDSLDQAECISDAAEGEQESHHSMSIETWASIEDEMSACLDALRQAGADGIGDYLIFKKKSCFI